MNKNLKFRVWDGKRFHEWGYIDKGFGVVFVSPPAPHYVSQAFTGIKDITGKELYSGDLVECKTTYGDLVKEIVWDSDRCGFFMKSSFVAYDTKNLYKLSGKRMKIVGNIFETPELIEVKQ